MTKFGCDHSQFIPIKATEKMIRNPDYSNPASVDEMIARGADLQEDLQLVGMMIACVWCGHRKTIWEDGKVEKHD